MTLPAYPARMALVVLLIKERYGFSDESVVMEIKMNPYLQHFLVLREYRYAAPFDASMLTCFQHRITQEMLEWVNDCVIGRLYNDAGHDEDGSTGGEGGGTVGSDTAKESDPGEGKPKR